MDKIDKIPLECTDSMVIDFFRNKFPLINEAAKKLPLYLIGLESRQEHYYTLRKLGFLYYQLLFVEEGTGVLTYNDTEIALSKGSCIFIPRRIPHAYYRTSKQFLISWVTMDGAFIQELIQQFGLEDITVIRAQNLSALLTIHQKMLVIMSHRYDAERLSVLTYELLIEFYKQKKNEKVNMNNLILMEQIKNYIDENYRADISLDLLSDRFKSSKFIICRHFSRTYGVSPGNYQIYLRIQEAKQLLITTNYSVKKIGEIVGFEDNVYFGKVFKKLESITPREYRMMS